MTIREQRLTQIQNVRLSKGSHPNLEAGACVMEMVAFVAGEPWTDKPQCASPVLASYCRALNDRMPDDQRQRLIPFIPRLVGTRDDKKESDRAFLLADAAVRVFAPLALDSAKLPEQAAKLRALAPIKDKVSANAASHASARAAAYYVAYEAAYEAAYAAAAAAAYATAWDEAIAALEKALAI